MKEIRFHGRGGQGAVTAGDILASALGAEDKDVAAFPMYGAERRGAPVTSFLRFDDNPIREKSFIYFPDCLIVLDPSQLDLPTLFLGLKPRSIMVVNTSKLLTEPPHPNVRLIGVVDATKIALEEMGVPIPNTCMLGALAATIQWVNIDSILSALELYFKGDRLKKNLRSVQRGFAETKVREW